MGDVAIMYDVIFPLKPLQSLFGSSSKRAASHKIFEARYLGTDKATLDIRVNLTGCLGCFRSFCDSPGTHLVLASSEEGDQIKQEIANLNHAIRTQLRQTKRLQIFVRILFGQLRQFSLQTCRNRNDLGTLALRMPGNRRNTLQFVSQRISLHIFTLTNLRQQLMSV